MRAAHASTAGRSAGPPPPPACRPAAELLHKPAPAGAGPRGAPAQEGHDELAARPARIADQDAQAGLV